MQNDDALLCAIRPELPEQHTPRGTVARIASEGGACILHSAVAFVRDPLEPLVAPEVAGDQIHSDPQLVQHESQGELILIGPFEVLCPPNIICFSQLCRQWLFPRDYSARVQARVRLNTEATVVLDLLVDREVAI